MGRAAGDGLRRELVSLAIGTAVILDGRIEPIAQIGQVAPGVARETSSVSCSRLKLTGAGVEQHLLDAIEAFQLAQWKSIK